MAICCGTTKTRAALRACSSTLVKWCPQGFKPTTWQTNVRDNTAKGVPIAAHRVQESPLYPLSVQTALNLQIRNDIVWIIVVEEVMVKGLAEHEPHGQRQQQAARAIP